MRASCPLADETHTLQDLGRMKYAFGMEVEADAGILPACGCDAHIAGPGQDERCGRDASGGRCGQDARAPRS